MPALLADIGAASRDVVVASWADATIAARYPSARDGSVTPSEGYFDSATDALTLIVSRGSLIGTERRRFTVISQGESWPAVSTSVPQIDLIDSEQVVGGMFLVARVELDLEAETTTHELFG